jgi:hypothetical protein
MLYLDGVYAEDAYGKVRFLRIKAPTADELGVLVHRISQRVADSSNDSAITGRG